MIFIVVKIRARLTTSGYVKPYAAERGHWEHMALQNFDHSQGNVLQSISYMIHVVLCISEKVIALLIILMIIT